MSPCVDIVEIHGAIGLGEFKASLNDPTDGSDTGEPVY